MKQKITVDANAASTTGASIRKIGTVLGSAALAVLTIGTITVFGLANPQEPQNDTKAAITNTTTTAVSEKETKSETLAVDTVVWKKAGISEYDTALTSKETQKAETTSEITKAVKETKVKAQKMYATEIVNLTKKASKDSDIVAYIAKDEFVTVTAKTSNGWYAVKYDDYNGYVMQKYLTKDVPESAKQSKETAKTTTASTAETTKKTTSKKTSTTKNNGTSSSVSTSKPSGNSGNSPVISYTDEEFEMLCYVLQGEVGHCSEASKIAVANVIINRVKSPLFQDSISGVLTAGNQFTAISNYYNKTNTPSENTRDCAKRALNGEDNSNGATYYYAPQYCGGSTAAWFESLNFCMELEGQRFFKNW